MTPSGLNSEGRLPEQSNASDAASGLVAAAAQIGVALQESQQPVAELGALLGQIHLTSQALRELVLPAVDAASATKACRLVEQLQSDVFRGVGQLQFYDRMVQHLQQLQDYLLHAAEQMMAAPPAMDRDSWRQLNLRLRDRLISDAQRALLDLYLERTPDGGPVRTGPPAQLASPDSLELF